MFLSLQKREQRKEEEEKRKEWVDQERERTLIRLRSFREVIVMPFSPHNGALFRSHVAHPLGPSTPRTIAITIDYSYDDVSIHTDER